MKLEEKIKEKLKVVRTREMPNHVLDALLATHFHGNILDHHGDEPNDIGRLFNGNEVFLVTYPLQCDSGHLQWSSQEWYEERGLRPEEPFVLILDIGQVTEHLRKYWRFKK